MKLPGLGRLRTAWQTANAISGQLETVQLALGRIESRQLANVPAGQLAAAEFKVWSQWGEDGIIEHLLRHVAIANTVFVEFGVQDYSEANTRFLLRNRNWSGLIFDGSEENIARVRRDSVYWQHDLTAQAAFITRDNINALISDQGVSGDIGLLSIDIDGNDYWVWEAISIVSPRIVIVEYNALFGPTAAVSIPYDAGFKRSQAHFSNLYWGCSLRALEYLGKRRRYVLIGCNSNGNNAFFVRDDVAAPFTTAVDLFRPSRFRESRSADGGLSFLSGSAALEQIGYLPLVDVGTLETKTVAEFVPTNDASKT